MTSNQLTVSAIRQQFESFNYLETAHRQSTKQPKHAVALKPESDAVTQKKQPPKTRPKPKISVGQSVDGLKSAGDIAMPSRSVVSVRADRQCCNVNADCTGRPTDQFMLKSRLGSSTSDPSLAVSAGCKESEHGPLSSCVPKQPMRASAKRLSRHEMEASVKDSLPSRWASTSSLLSDVASCSTDDIKEAIRRAKQKIVLQRIVGMNLEGESLPYEAHRRPESHLNVVDTHGKDVNGFPSTRVDVDLHPLHDSATSLPAAGDVKSLSVSTDAVLHADNESTTDAVTPAEPNPLLDSQVNNTVIERTNSSPTSETLPTTIENEESRSTETALYPHDMQLSPLAENHSRASVTDASLTTKDWITGTPPSSLSRLQNDQLSPLTENTHVTSAKRRQGSGSRRSYVVLSKFVGENFSFLDELDDTEDSRYLSGDAADTRGADIEQTVASTSSTSTDCSKDQASSATTARDRSDDKEQTAEMPRRNERPKSLLRRSIVLPNGEILDIIGNAFDFLDDYSDQTEDTVVPEPS